MLRTWTPKTRMKVWSVFIWLNVIWYNTWLSGLLFCIRWVLMDVKIETENLGSQIRNFNGLLPGLLLIHS